MVKMSSRASSFARSVPTPQSVEIGASSGGGLISGGGIGGTIQTVPSNLNHRDFGAAVKTEIVIIAVSDAGIDVERASRGVKKSHVVFVHGEGNDGRTKKRNPPLPAVRVAREDQIEFSVAE